MFFKKPIKFYCELPEVREKYPIIPASSYKFNWFKQSSLDFKKTALSKGSYEQVTGIIRCPGVKSILKKGYIVRSWFDLTIKPLNNGAGVEYYIPEGIYSYLEEKNYTKKLISFFSPDNSSHVIPLTYNQLPALIKITLPWSVSIPKNKELITIPIPYPDITEFTSVHGILESGDFYQLNAIIKINQIDKEFTIPAGTPLLQLIPIDTKNEPVEFLNYDNKIKSLEIKDKFLSNNTFIVKK
jgi:hypothetical protein